MVDLSSLTPPIALGPLDGRYRSVTAPLTNYLSEAALNRARLQVEVEWLIHLTEGHVLPGAPVLSAAEKAYLRDVVASFGADEIAELAEIEAVTRHDVKAVEYLLKRRLDAAPAALGEDTVLPTVHEIVHIFCTSEDINNLSYALTIPVRCVASRPPSTWARSTAPRAPTERTWSPCLVRTGRLSRAASSRAWA